MLLQDIRAKGRSTQANRWEEQPHVEVQLPNPKLSTYDIQQELGDFEKDMYVHLRATLGSVLGPLRS